MFNVYSLYKDLTGIESQMKDETFLEYLLNFEKDVYKDLWMVIGISDYGENVVVTRRTKDNSLRIINCGKINIPCKPNILEKFRYRYFEDKFRKEICLEIDKKK